MKLNSISGIRITHKHASIDEINRVCQDDQQETIRQLLANEPVSEALVLQTCNRVEAYVVTDDPTAGRDILDHFVSDATGEAIIEMDHEGCLRHLMRVAAGLESLVLGEDQILGQVRDAYQDAQNVEGIGPLLDPAVTKAIHVGQRARSETAINEGIRSIGSAAGRLAANERDLTGDTALIIGAGKMGRTAARAIAETGIEKLIVANRTVDRAARITDAITGVETQSTGLENLSDIVERVNVVITATESDGYVLDAGTFESAGETLVIDIAHPRDVDPGSSVFEGCTVYDLDRLDSLLDQTRQQRSEAASEVEAMIDRECEQLLKQYKQARVDEVIATMYERANQIKADELETTLSKLDAQGEVTDDQQEIIESLADAVVSKLLAAPTKSLKEAAVYDDWAAIYTALRLFDPNPDSRSPESDPAMVLNEIPDQASNPTVDHPRPSVFE